MNKVKKAFYRAGCIAMQVLYAVGRFFKKLWQHKQGRIGLIIVAFLALLAIFAPLIAPYDPYDVTQRADKGLLPSWEHLLGTSITTGQDIFSMVIYGTRSSLSIGLITGIVIAVLGSILGVAAGYLGGWVDTIIMRIVDVLLVIPTLPLVIVMTNVLGTSYVVIVIVFAAFGWTGLARVIRSQVMLIKNANYVKAAELAGASKWYIMWRHILPAVSNLLIMSTALTSAGIMVAEAGLSFLGLGNPEAISWGKMLADAQSSGAMLFGHWWSIIAPGVGIFLSVFNVHVNRAPAEWSVSNKIYREGRYLDARHPECARENEAMTLAGTASINQNTFPMAVRQISGAIARRIVCPVQPGDVFAHALRALRKRLFKKFFRMPRADRYVIFTRNKQRRSLNFVCNINRFDFFSYYWRWSY